MTAHIRLNKSGQQELVRKKKGKRDVGTLNELDKLSDSVSGLIEYKQSIKYNPDCGLLPLLDDIDCLIEFVGTGAIAFAPGLLKPPVKKSRRHNQNTTKSENDVTTKRRTINEWLPPFKGNGYEPGEHTMPTPSGKGVADRTPTQEKVGSYDTESSAIGKEWPRDHNSTEAMDGVDDENISDSASGAHESTHGEADDGHQKKVGHDWPKQPKNSGQGVAEPFTGDRWSDGGTLTGGRGPGADTWTDTDGSGMPSTGPITGTSGPQLGHVGEGWSPNNMAKLMGEDFDIQSLFNNYARSATAVCLEDFQQLCDAHGAGVVLDEVSITNLMRENQEFMFYEGTDADGPYWVPESIVESRRPARRTMTEAYRPELEDPMGGAGGRGMGMDDQMGGQMDDMDDPMGGMGGPMGGMGGPMGGVDDPMGGPMGGMDDPMGGPMGGMDDPMGGMDDPMGGVGGLECPGCGYQGEDAECPECGIEMMDPAGDLGEEPVGQDRAMDPMVNKLTAPPMESRRTITNSPNIVESLKRFMESAKSLISSNPTVKNRDLAEALQHSWSYHAGNVDARQCPTKVQQTLQGLMTKYPGFNPLCENDAMDAPEGTKLGGGDGPKIDLPSPKTEMTTNGDKSLLGKSQKNTLDGTPTIPGTGKGMAEGAATKQIRENIARLAIHVKRSIAENAKALQHGKYTTQFSVLVAEGSTTKKPKKKVRTAKRDSLAEALADAEEILQLHNPSDVTFETMFLGPQGQITMKQDTPLFTINPRGPMVGEGKALFRFQRSAEAFANQLVSEGITCRVIPHNWGSAVEARTNYSMAKRAFGIVAECGNGCGSRKRK